MVSFIERYGVIIWISFYGGLMLMVYTADAPCATQYVSSYIPMAMRWGLYN